MRCTYSWRRVRIALGQPELVLAILALLYLRVQEVRVLPSRIDWPILVPLLIAQALTIHIWEYLKFGSQPVVYHGRSIWSWGSGFALWAWVIYETGGISSPFLLACALMILLYQRNPRRQRYSVVLLLLVFAGFSSWLAGLRLAATIGPIVFGIIMLSYCFVFMERQPREQNFILSLGSFGCGYLDKESVLRATLARAMRLYRADAGFVSVPIEPKTTQSGQVRSRQPELQVRYRVGKKIDDPSSNYDHDRGRQSKFDRLAKRQHVSHRAFVEGIAIRWRPRAYKQAGIPFGIRTEFAFALKRPHSDEVFAVVTVLTKLPFSPLFPASNFDLGILCMGAEMIYEAIVRADSYQSLLPANNPQTFSKELAISCHELIPREARTADVKLSISTHIKRPDGAVIVPVFQPLAEGRRRPRYVSVSARIEHPNLSVVQTIRIFLRRVASANILQRMAAEKEALQASNKGLIGLANLEPPDRDFAEKIGGWNGEKTHYNQIFRGCGFRLLWANRLMRTWNPRIPEGKLLDDQQTCEHRYCYMLFNSEEQQSPCWDCPCLHLYRKYLTALGKDEKSSIASSVEIRPSHSPAGRMQIYRHFELQASLILNEFAPQEDASPEDEVSFIRETVIDRTLAMEVQAILTKVAKKMDMFPTHSSCGQELGQEGYDRLVHGMFGIVVEGLGRSFQANHVFKVRMTDSMLKIEADYVCKYAGADEKTTKALVDAERVVLEKVACQGLGIEDYFAKRPPLYVLQAIDKEQFMPPDVVEILTERIRRIRHSHVAEELRRKDYAGLFRWREEDHRCIIVRIHATDWILLIFTDTPEYWERSGSDDELLPRTMELELCQSVGSVLGHLMDAVGNALQWKFEDRSRIILETWRSAAAAFSHRMGNTLPRAQSELQEAVRKLEKQDEVTGGIKVALYNIERAIRITNDYERFATTGRRKQEDYLIEDILNQVAEDLRMRYPAVSIDLHVDKGVSGVKIRADREGLTEAFAELVTNSVRAHPNDRPSITINCRLTVDERPSMIAIVYTDDGKGIPEDKKARIFDPFYTTSDVGTGIGLADVRNVVWFHGGTIELMSKSGKGARFEIKLPVL